MRALAVTVCEITTYELIMVSIRISYTQAESQRHDDLAKNWRAHLFSQRACVSQLELLGAVV